MKFVKYLKYSLLGAATLLMGGCADDTFHIDGPNDGEMPDELQMALIIPAPVAVDLTRSGQFGVDNLYLFYFGEAGYIDKTPVTLTPDNISTNAAGNTIVTVNVPNVAGANKLQVIINAPADKIGADSCTDPSTIWTDYFSGSEPILWGEAEIIPGETNPTIALVRNTAIVSLKLDPSVQNFKILEFGLFGTATSGSVAPADTVRATDSNGKLKLISKKPMISADNTYPFAGPNGGEEELMFTWQAGTAKQSITGVFETPGHYKVAVDGSTFKNDSARIIIKGQYRDENGTTIDGYYVAAFCKQEKVNQNPNFSETPGYFKYGPSLDILRHHEYILTITEVRSEGWKTLGQAVKAKPDNRTTWMVTDKSNAITDIEATRDYYLGVGGDVTTSYTGSVTIDVATTYPGLVDNPTWRDRLEFEKGDDDDWIHTENAALADDNDASDPTTFRIRIPLDQNNSPNDRYGFIKVRAGKLSRTIYLTQEGFPYSRQRKVTVSGIPGFSSTDNYYSWIEGTEYDANGIATVERPDSVKGLTRAQNLGNVNRIGLHFPLVPLYDNVSYTIPALGTDGEPSFVTGGADFSYKREGDNYIITLTNPDVIKSATGRFRIPAKAGDTDEMINIDYDLFRTGVFHYLDPDYSKYQTPEESTHKSGWFYYEVVRVGNTYVLDRDLGASSNRPYTPGSSTYRKNIESVGGYFMVNTDRWTDYKTNTKRREDQQTITAQMGLTAQTPSKGRFVPATENDIFGWELDCSSVVSANISSGRVSGGKIYIPKAGYYEGDEKKSQMHSMLWSRTYLGGTQGLDPEKSAEYGYWYRYFDDMKSANPENRYSNIRLARGSNGSKAVLGSSIYRYMPLRLVWVNSDCQNPYYSGDDEEDEIKGIIVYVKNESDWADIYYHAWDLESGNTDWGTLPKMTKVAGQTNLWRCELGAPTKASAGILFASRTNPGDNDGSKTTDFKDIYQLYTKGDRVFYFTLKSNHAPVLTDSSDQDIYQNQNNNQYNYYITGTSTTFFTADSTQKKALVKSGSNYVLSEMACEASTFMIEVRDKETGELVKVLRWDTGGNGTVVTGTQMDVTDKSTADGAKNWKLGTADTYTFTFNPKAMKLRVDCVGVTNDYQYHVRGSIFNGTWQNRKMTFNPTTKVYEILNVQLTSGQFGIRKDALTSNITSTTDGGQLEWLFGVGTGNPKVVVNTPMPIVVEGSATGSNWTLSRAGTYDITFDPAAMTLTFTQEERDVYYRLVNGPNGNATQYMTTTQFTKSGNKYVLIQQPFVAGDIKVEEVAEDNGELLNTYWANTEGAGRNIELEKDMPGQEASSGGASWYVQRQGYFNVTFDPDNITLKLEDNIPSGMTVNINFRSNAILGTSDWTEKRMTYNNGVYVLENVPLKSGKFEFLRYAGDYQCCTFMAESDHNNYTIGTTVAFNHYNWQATGYDSWTISGDYHYYKITFNLTQKTFKIEKTHDPEFDYYVRGEIFGNGWTNNKMTRNTTTGVYELKNVTLTAGEFVIRRTISNTGEGDEETPSIWSSGSNHTITAGTASNAVIKDGSNGANWTSNITGLCNITFDPAAMTVKIEKAAEPEFDYFVRGEIFGNGWTNKKMTRNTTTGVYELKNVTLNSGQFGIRRTISNTGEGDDGSPWIWSSGSNHTITAGTASNAVIKDGSNGANWTSNITGLCNITFDPAAMTVKIETITNYVLYIETDMTDTYIYMWKDGNPYQTGGWPGTELTTTQTINGTTYYKYTIPRDFSGLKFNNGSSKQSGEFYLSNFASDQEYVKITVTETNDGISATIVGYGAP